MGEAATASTGTKFVAQAPAFGTGFAGIQREPSCEQSMVRAGRRSTGKHEAVAELDLVPLSKECQEFKQGYILRRAGEEPCASPKFARHNVRERPDRNTFRVFGDEFDDFMPVDLVGGHARSLPPARRRGTERKVADGSKYLNAHVVVWKKLDGSPALTTWEYTSAPSPNVRHLSICRLNNCSGNPS